MLDLRAPCASTSSQPMLQALGKRLLRLTLRWALPRSFSGMLQRGAWTRLLTPPSAWLREHDLLSPESELPGDMQFVTHPVAEAAARVPRTVAVEARIQDAHAHKYRRAWRLFARGVQTRRKVQICEAAFWIGFTSMPRCTRQGQVCKPGPEQDVAGFSRSTAVKSDLSCIFLFFPRRLIPLMIPPVAGRAPTLSAAP